MKEIRKSFKIVTAPSTTESFTIPGPGIAGPLRISAESISGTIAYTFKTMSDLFPDVVFTSGSPDPIINTGDFQAEWFNDSGNVGVNLINASATDPITWTIEYQILNFG